jgi:HEPN domain-containing protein
MTPEIEEALRLLRLARRDLDTAELLLPLSKATIAAIGFHAQQCAEKALKAVCAMRAIEIRRTHDLAALAHEILNDGGSLPVSVDDLRSLNPFAVEFRYDDDIAPALARDEVARLAASVLQWAAAQVGASK